MRTWTAADWELAFPGLLDRLEKRGVDISNNVGAIIVDGYLGDIVAEIIGSH